MVIPDAVFKYWGVYVGMNYLVMGNLYDDCHSRILQNNKELLHLKP
jgi:hypothetical protein